MQTFDTPSVLPKPCWLTVHDLSVPGLPELQLPKLVRCWDYCLAQTIMRFFAICVNNLVFTSQIEVDSEATLHD